MDCKTVSGTGPLTGDYILIDTEESKCGDGCAYNRLGEPEENRYCFVKEDGLYTVEECEQVGMQRLGVIDKNIPGDTINRSPSHGSNKTHH